MQARVLRPYQVEATEAVRTAWNTGMARPSVVLPTGTGKSSVIGSLAVWARSQGERVILLAHRAELLDQMAAAVAAIEPGGQEVGILQGNRRSYSQDIVAASFQTLASGKHFAKLGRRGIVLVDEAHHAPAKTYVAALEALGCTDETTGVLTAGFTATMDRSDGGLGDVWDGVVYEKDLRWAISSGYLVAPRGLTVVLPGLNLDKVKKVAGDYAAGELESAMASSVETTVTAIKTHALGRTGIIFAAGVEHARALAECLMAEGISARAVTGDMSRDDREEVYQLFHDGLLEFMVTVQVLTEGADFPRCDAAIMARPTQSQVLYTQMVGRALRPFPGKDDALVLDLAGITRSMSLVSLVNLDPKAETKRVSPTSEEDPGQEEPTGPRPKKWREGVVDLEETDLLAGSNVRWLRTKAGAPFFQTEDWLVFIWEDTAGDVTTAGKYLVGYMTAKGNKEGGWSDNDYEDAASALTAAEEWTRAAGLPLPRRTASQYRSVPPSDAQVRFAKSLGVQSAENMTRARISDAISIALASARID